MADYLNDVKAALKTIFTGQTVLIGTDTFTLHPFNPAPPKLDTAQLPAQFTFTGSAGYDFSTSGREHVRESRIYRVQFAVLTVAEATPELRETRVGPWINLARERLAAYPTLGRLKFVESARPLRDTGIVILPEYQQQYIGFEIQLSVTMDLPIVYARGEA